MTADARYLCSSAHGVWQERTCSHTTIIVRSAGVLSVEIKDTASPDVPWERQGLIASSSIITGFSCLVARGSTYRTRMNTAITTDNWPLDVLLGADISIPQRPTQSLDIHNVILNDVCALLSMPTLLSMCKYSGNHSAKQFQQLYGETEICTLTLACN